MAKPCECHADEGCPKCDAGMTRLSDDIDITQSIELLTGATLDLETGERQFEGTYSHLVIEDCDRIAALLHRLRERLKGETANGRT